jgi:hypothetical protein
LFIIWCQNGSKADRMEWLLELSLIVLLTLTLFHAVRLERALGVLKRDRSAMQALVEEFNASSKAAEQGILQLRQAAEGTGRMLERQVEGAKARSGDLEYLAGRAESLADRLEAAVRSARPLALDVPPASATVTPLVPPPASRPRSQAEQDLMKALQLAR